MLDKECLAPRPLQARIDAVRAKSVSCTTPLRASGPPAQTAQSSGHPAGENGRRPLTKPSPGEFYVTEEVWEQLSFAVTRGKNVLLTGPSGCGKSELCYRVAEAAGRAFEPFNCGAMSEPRSTLIGNTHFDRQSGTWFAESRFVRAVQQAGACILLDELNRAGREAFNILLPLLDTQGYLAIDEAQATPVVRRAERVTIFATANLGMEYTGTEPLDRALAERFPVVITIDFPPRSDELTLLLRRCPGLSKDSARCLIDLAVRQRELAAEGEFVGLISTRSLLAAGEQIAAGLPVETAVKYCIANRFSADGGDVSERTKVLQILQKFRG